MTPKALGDLRELRKIGLHHTDPKIRFQMVWGREPLGAALRQYKFEQTVCHG